MVILRLIGLVPAAGSGTRAGGALPRQYVDLDGMPLLARTVQRLLTALTFERLYVVVTDEDAHVRRALAAFGEPVAVLPCGGPTRAATVRNAAHALAPQLGAMDWLLVHDAARPCVPVETLRRLMTAVANDPVGALLAVPVADTLKRTDGNDPPRVHRTEARARLWQAQTPQVFRWGVLQRALALPAAADVTDEAQAVELLAAGGGCALPRLVPGSTQNIQVTYPADLALAAAILAMQVAGLEPPH
ncbi:MAG: 2-C-methyl-D-erythritol 4-phosphate cytidylyltransferase [Casimicrobiaceae bacterium]